VQSNVSKLCFGLQVKMKIVIVALLQQILKECSISATREVYLKKCSFCLFLLFLAEIFGAVKTSSTSFFH